MTNESAIATRLTTLEVPTDAAMRALCAREHHRCFACRPAEKNGLGLLFSVQADRSVAAQWRCPAGCESYAGIVHGGLLATALDSAMVHVLFAHNIVALTGELTVRYLQSVRADRLITVVARLSAAYPPLFQLKAEIHQQNILCARANAKFMANQSLDLTLTDPSPPTGVTVTR